MVGAYFQKKNIFLNTKLVKEQSKLSRKDDMVFGKWQANMMIEKVFHEISLIYSWYKRRAKIYVKLITPTQLWPNVEFNSASYESNHVGIEKIRFICISNMYFLENN